MQLQYSMPNNAVPHVILAQYTPIEGIMVNIARIYRCF